MWTTFWGTRRGTVPCKGAERTRLRAVLARAGAFIGFMVTSGLLWWAVVPVPQSLLAIAFGGGWHDAYLRVRGAVGAAALAVSACLVCFPRARTALVRAMTRRSESNEARASRYLDILPRSSMPMLVSAVLGAALVVAGYALTTSWIRLAPSGAAAWAAGVLPVAPGWAAACVVAVCAGAVGCFCIIGRLPGLATAAIGLGTVVLCVLGLLSCGPSVASFALSLLFGVQLMGAVAAGWRDVAPALRALVALELVPVLALASGAVAFILRAVVPDTEMGAHRPFVLLLAMSGCALAALAARAARTRGQRAGDGDADRSCQGAAGRRGGQAPACTFEVPEACGLSERERSVLLGSLQGRSLAQLAQELGVSRSTAGTYRLRAYTKLGVESLEDARSLLGAEGPCEAGAPGATVGELGSAVGLTMLPAPVGEPDCTKGLMASPAQVDKPDRTVDSTAFSVASAVARFMDRVAVSGGWIAWFVLAGVLLAPWCGSRAWLLADAWRALPSAVLVVVTGYLVLDGAAPSVRLSRCVSAAGAACAALLALLLPVLPGGHAAVGELPVLFDFVLAAALAFGLSALSGRGMRADRVRSDWAFAPCACVAAGACVASSAVAGLYLAVIAVAACALAAACVWCAVAAEPVDGSARDGGSVRDGRPVQVAERARDVGQARADAPQQPAGPVRADAPQRGDNPALADAPRRGGNPAWADAPQHVAGPERAEASQQTADSVHAEAPKRGDDSARVGELARVRGDACAEQVLPVLDGVGFVPHGGQAICLVGGLSAWGWGLYQAGACTLVEASSVSRMPPAMAACVVIAYAYAACLMWACRRDVHRPSRRAWGVAGLVGGAALCCLWATGGSGVAAPLAQALLTAPMLVLAGAACEMLAAFRAAHRCASFGFAMPTLLLTVFAVWCCGPFIAMVARDGFAGGDWVAAAVVAAGGMLGAVSLNSIWRTLHKRAALRAAGLQAVERALRKAGLTQMEARVAALLCTGRAAREVAAELFIEPSTVRSHTRRAYAKLAVHTRGELEVAAATLVREHAR